MDSSGKALVFAAGLLLAVLTVVDPLHGEETPYQGAPRWKEHSREPAVALRFDTVGASPRAVVPPGSYDLSIAGDFELGGFVFKGGHAFIHTDDPSTLSTAVGRSALVSSTPGVPYAYSGTNNTALGAYALTDNTEGFRNSAVGYAALRSNTEGSRNTAVGYTSLVSNTLGLYNTATGASALTFNTEGSFNTATGAFALNKNVTGGQNSAFGWSALYANTDGSQNTGIGEAALAGNTMGNANTAVGASAMVVNGTGSKNTALGTGALNSNPSGSRNTAVGVGALLSGTGSDSIALGYYAGINATSGSHGIFIGNQGEEMDANLIRVGDANHSRTFIAGIVGVTLPKSGTQVFIDNNNQLGTATSSRRFKERIEDMGESSSALDELRPVTFRYTEEAVGEGPRPIEFGLIAEEVAEVYPELVAYDREGRPYSVRYHALAPMLLNELQRVRREVKRLEAHNEELKGRVMLLESSPR